MHHSGWEPRSGVCVAGLVLARPLEPRRVTAADGSAWEVERWLALDRETSTDQTVYRWPLLGRADRAQVSAAVDALDDAGEAHTVGLRRIEGVPDHRIWAFSPYLGNMDGLVTLPRLVALRGESLTPAEVGRAIGQVLGSLELVAKVTPALAGELDVEAILVDRSGGLWCEWTGLEGLAADVPAHGAGHGAGGRPPRREGDSVRRVAEFAYTALTGWRVDEGFVRPSRMVPRLGRGWDAWFEAALDPALGYHTAALARAALESAGGFSGGSIAGAATAGASDDGSGAVRRVWRALRLVGRRVGRRGPTAGGSPTA